MKTTRSRDHATPAYSITLRLALRNKPGMFARLATAIGRAGGSLGAVDLVGVQDGFKIRDVVVLASSAEQDKTILERVRRVPGARLIHWSDRTFLAHLGGKLEIVPRVPLKTRDDLSMIYTPGVARVCEAIHENPDDVWNLTIKRSTVAIVTDGSRVLGLGDIGPEAALPVMEGKAALFKTFGGLNAFPLCLAVKDPEEFIETVVRIAPAFGGINLEDIATPRCFEIERELARRLPIPVMHDDQHGTAIVAVAGLINALKIARKDIRRARIVMTGAGAAGIGVASLLVHAGAARIIGFDTCGAVYSGRKENMNPYKEEYAAKTNRDKFRGSLAQALRGADVFIGLAGPGTVKAGWLRGMARDPIVFCLENPDPAVRPEDMPFVRITATGRSDYPNQVNNALAFPGVFRGALDARARRITTSMKMAAARAIAALVKPKELAPDCILPSIFNPEVGPAVAKAVSRAAVAAGVAGKNR